MDDQNLEELEEKNIPTVLIPGHVEGIESKLASVDSENVRSVFHATDHLIKHGHKRIAFIAGASNSRYTLERSEGYRKAFEQNNMIFRQQYIILSDFSKIEGFKKMRKLLMRKNAPTAVIGINEAVTIGAIQAIRKKRLKIPKDISVVSIGDSEYVNGPFPPLTAIQIPMVEIGRRAALTLIKILDGVTLKKKRIVLPSGFVVRKSTDICSDLTS
jgi:LacI family repressor for deo operon, udp, cdd, tsx, nupC, and nupG